MVQCGGALTLRPFPSLVRPSESPSSTCGLTRIHVMVLDLVESFKPSLTMKECRTLEYTHDMPVVPVLPGEHVRIRSALNLSNGQDTALIKFQLVPFQNHVYPGQWFHGFDLAVETHQLCRGVRSEIVAVARQQAAAISEKLQVSPYDFTQAHV